MSQDEFASGLIARDNLTPEAAACVSGYLVGALPDDQLRLVIEPDAAGVLPQVWGRYTQVLLACRFHDDLGVASAPGEGGGP